MKPWLPLSLLSLLLLACGGSDNNTDTPVVIAPPPVVVPPVGDRPALPAATFSGQLSYIHSFLKLAAIIRYHHPGDAVATTNWESFLTETVYLIATADSPTAAEQQIWQQLSRIAPDLQLNGRAGANRQLQNASSFRVWQQNGYKDEDTSSIGSYQRQRLTLSPSQLANQPQLPVQQQYEYRDALLSAVIPLVSAVSGNATVPAGEAFTSSARYQLPTNLDHPMVCLAAAGEIWGILNHFFPYFATIQTNWGNELEPLLQSCVSADRLIFEKQLHLSLTKLQDNHVSLTTPNTGRWLGSYLTPVRFEWIENKLVAVYKTPAVTDIKLGDELLEVNGKPVAEVMAELSQIALVSKHRAANQVAQMYLLRAYRNTQFQLTLKNQAGQLYNSSQLASEAGVLAYRVRDELSFKQQPQFLDLASDIGYVNLAKTMPADIANTITKLRNKKAVVLDLRNYPQSWDGWFQTLPYFAGRAISSAPMYHHYANHPESALKYRLRLPQTAPAQSPRLNQPVVILSSRYSVSQNEHALAYAQNAGIPVMGETTFGINGEITQYQLFGGANNGGISGIFTGMEVTQHDGSAMIGVGIQPDLPAPLTIEGIRQQRDVQLDAAVQYLQRRINNP